MVRPERDPFADMPDEWKEENKGNKAFNNNEPRDPNANKSWLHGWDIAKQSYMHELRLSTVAKSIAMHSVLDYRQACNVARDALREWDNLNATIPADRKSAV